MSTFIQNNLVASHFIQSNINNRVDGKFPELPPQREGESNDKYFKRLLNLFDLGKLSIPQDVALFELAKTNKGWERAAAGVYNAKVLAGDFSDEYYNKREEYINKLKENKTSKNEPRFRQEKNHSIENTAQRQNLKEIDGKNDEIQLPPQGANENFNDYYNRLTPEQQAALNSLFMFEADQAEKAGDRNGKGDVGPGSISGNVGVHMSPVKGSGEIAIRQQRQNETWNEYWDSLSPEEQAALNSLFMFKADQAEKAVKGNGKGDVGPGSISGHVGVHMSPVKESGEIAIRQQRQDETWNEYWDSLSPEEQAALLSKSTWITGQKPETVNLSANKVEVNQLVSGDHGAKHQKEIVIPQRRKNETWNEYQNRLKPEEQAALLSKSTNDEVIKNISLATKGEEDNFRLQLREAARQSLVTHLESLADKRPNRRSAVARKLRALWNRLWRDSSETSKEGLRRRVDQFIAGKMANDEDRLRLLQDIKENPKKISDETLNKLKNSAAFREMQENTEYLIDAYRIFWSKISHVKKGIRTKTQNVLGSEEYLKHKERIKIFSHFDDKARREYPLLFKKV